MIDHPMDRTLLTPWWHHLCVMAAYAAMDNILFSMSSVNWVLTAGLRLSCLLLVPRRFWGALIIGELLSIAATTVPSIATFGMGWGVAVLIPSTLYSIPFIYLMQDHLPIFDRQGRIIPSRVLVAALLSAGAGTLRRNIAISALVMQNGSPAVVLTWSNTLELIIGSYIGALTITPCILAIRERLLQQTQPLTWHELMKRSILRDVLMFELPIVVALVLASHFLIGDGNLTYFRTAMIVPVILLSVRHGWYGTAVSGMVASFFLSATALDHRDPSLIPAWAVLALAISLWLIWTQRYPPKAWVSGVAGASAWIALMSLIPLHSIRRTFSPRYAGSDGMRYDVDGRTIGKA